MNWISTIIASLPGLLVAVAAVLVARRAVSLANERSARSVSLKKLTEIEIELTEQADSIAALRQSLSKLRSRKSMRELRARRENGAGENLGAISDKNQLRLAAKERGLLR